MRSLQEYHRDSQLRLECERGSRPDHAHAFRRTGPVDLAVELGPVHLPNPIVAASGTFGHGGEVAALCAPPTRSARSP